MSRVMNTIAAVTVATAAPFAFGGGPNLLLNPNFEVPGGLDVFDEWVDFGGNIIPELLLPLEGVASVHMFGQFSGPGQNDTVMIQGNAGLGGTEIPITGGNQYSFAILSEQRTGDLLEPLAFCLVDVQFKDAANTHLQSSVIFIGDNRDLDGDTFPDQIYPPADTPTFTVTTPPAPLTATKAEIIIVFVQINDALGSVYFDEASLVDLGPFDFTQPFNLSFEHGLIGQTPPGWITTGTNASQNGDAPTDGERALLQFGNFPGDGSLNDTITRSQTFALTPGDTVDASADVQHLSGDPLAIDNLAFLNVEFYDGIGALVGAEGVTALTSTSPTDTPQLAAVSAVAPAGAVSAAIALGYQQANEGGGAAHWDNVAYSVTPGALPCDGDANGDNVVDVNDISYVLFRLGDPCGAPGCDGDANGDGVVDVNDISYVLFRLGNPC